MFVVDVAIQVLQGAAGEGANWASMGAGNKIARVSDI